ncbi:MAG: tetratricopeptide repeat protein [Bacteroidales bacterium]
MSISFEPNDNDTIGPLMARLEKMLEGEENYFFDVEEFEELIEFQFFFGDLERAGKTISLALEQHPSTIGFLVKQAQLLLWNNKGENALQLLSSVEAIDPNNAEIFRTRGAIYSQMNRHNDAISELNKAAEVDESEDVGMIYVEIANEYMTMGLYDKAIDHFHLAINNDFALDNVLTELGESYDLGNRLDDGVDYFNKLVNESPYNSDAWLSLGLLQYRLELYEKAIEAYDYSLAIDPAYVAAMLNKANAYFAMGHYFKAINTYKEAFEIEEPEAMTIYCMGECYEKLEKYNLAVEKYKKALELDETLADAWIGIGVCLGEQGNFDAALRHILHAVELEPTNAEFWFILADTQQSAGHNDDAIQSFRKVAVIEPQNPDIWLEFSHVYAEREEYEMAIDVLNEGISLQPENAAHYYRLVGYLHFLGKLKEALLVFGHALQSYYNSYSNLFEYAPLLAEEPAYINLIEQLKPTSE